MGGPAPRRRKIEPTACPRSSARAKSRATRRRHVVLQPGEEMDEAVVPSAPPPAGAMEDSSIGVLRGLSAAMRTAGVGRSSVPRRRGEDDAVGLPETMTPTGRSRRARP